MSIDAADASINDRHRGLPGAFETTFRSIDRLLSKLPRFRKRLSISSTLIDQENFESLLRMPRLLSRLGIMRWQVGYLFAQVDGRAQPTSPLSTVIAWATALSKAAIDEGITFDMTDEFGTLRDEPRSELPLRRLYQPKELYRLDPVGGIRCGFDTLVTWRENEVPRWNPAKQDAVLASGYWDRA